MMECNRDEAILAKTIAEEKLERKDFVAAKEFVLKAQSLYPQLEGLPQMLTTIDIYISAANKVDGEADWYGVLGIKPTDDDETLKKQYRKLSLALHHDKNKSAGTDGAFKLLCEGWSLLSDKSKRLVYDQKRLSSTGLQQNVSMHSSSPSAPPLTNGFHSCASRMSSPPKTQHSNARMHPASVPGSSFQRSDTFWTICHQCKMHYEYMKMYLNQTLLCPNCHQAFLASETAPPFNYSKSSNSASLLWYQNSNNHAPASNSFHSGRNASSAAKCSGPGDARLHTSNYTNFRTSHFRAATVGRVDPAFAAKAVSVVQQASERIKREHDACQNTAGWEGHPCYNSTFTGEGLYKQSQLDDYGSQHGDSGFVGGSALRKNGFNPGFSGSDLTPVETRNILMEKARNVIVEKLNEWRSQTAAKATGSTEFKDRRKIRKKWH